uniref:Uncharacterized protein n=1 Tax=Meloidogyne floridensis TaxID=298350 RepID=A0A915P9S0_9BILA
MPIQDEHWCERMINGDLSINETKRLKEWKFNEENFYVEPPPDEDEMDEGIEITEEDDKCLNLQKLFLFHNKPLSKEENEYPLAYAMVTHKSVIQTMTMVSSVYQPQNAYCIVVDDKSSDDFLKKIQMLADCFPNIFVLNVGTIEWCKFGVVRAVFTCLKHLTEKNHNWRYLQYLSGVDLPLKTNLEMVRIFKQLNGTINADVLPFERYRVRLLKGSIKPPLTLWKSSLSALISREAADVMVKSDKVKNLLNYLQYTWCSDESLWATIAGNPEVCKEEKLKEITSKTFYNLYKHPITRTGKQLARCYGKFVKESCVFGVDDMPNLIRRPELVAHKMYMDFEPAAYFCLWKKVRERALDWREQKTFNAQVYSQLPSVRIARGDPEEQIQYFFDDICHLSISG